MHWVKPKLVAQITYLTWADDDLLRHTVFLGLREDKSAKEIWRERGFSINSWMRSLPNYVCV